MNSKIILIISFFLSFTLGFAQDVKEDTTVVLNLEEIKLVNKLVEDWNGVKEENIILDSIITKKDNIINIQDSIILSKDNIIQDYKNIAALTDKKRKETKKKNIIYSIGIAIISFISGGLVWR